MSITDSFREFLEDPNGWEFFITGQAGTGKTTLVPDLLNVCKELELTFVVAAHTHKACGILASKLPKGTHIQTTHSFLKKRPGINDNATRIEHLSSNTKCGKSEQTNVLFIDEYSMLGEKDYADIGLEQDPEGEGIPVLKVVYIGDPNQLPPVGDLQAVYPSGKYQHRLTKIWRQEGDNELLDTLTELVKYIEGETPKSLSENANFRRGVNLVDQYWRCIDSGIPRNEVAFLAYTNKRVQYTNQLLSGKDFPDPKDELFSPSTRKHYTYIGLEKSPSYIFRAFNDPLPLDSKYKSLEHLIDMGCCDFMEVINEDEEEEVWAVVFGHYDYKVKLQELGEAAVASNAAIEDLSDGIRAKDWANANKNHPMSRMRAKAWRDYITFKDCVICMDFPYAMTVHKSQGSTFDTVLIDMEDLGICAAKDYNMYLKLLYVAISRSSNMAFTN